MNNMVFSKRWPKRREFLAYYLLYRVFGCHSQLNKGVLIDILTAAFGSKSIASRLLRRLVKMRVVKRVAPCEYRVLCLNEVLDDALAHYLAKRLRRRGVTEVEALEGRLVVRCEILPEALRKLPFVVCREALRL